MGVLKGRIYDSELVTSNGGVLKILNETNFETGIKYFLKNLPKEGFLVDQHTFYAYVVNHDVNMEDIIITPTHIKGEHSFGMLVRSKDVYRYLRKFVVNNHFLLDSCRRNYINHKLSEKKFIDELEISYNIFSPEGGLFIPTLKYSCGLLGIAIVCGIGYEIWRKVKDGKNLVSCD